METTGRLSVGHHLGALDDATRRLRAAATTPKAAMFGFAEDLACAADAVAMVRAELTAHLARLEYLENCLMELRRAKA